MGFNSFRDLMNTWDQFLVEIEIDSKINSMIDEQGFIMFFKKKGDIYGATEEGRLVFAKMKQPDEEMPSGWDEEASFSAHNLNKMAKGETAQHLFKKDDLKELKIIDREEAIEELGKTVKDVGEKAFPQMGGLKILRIAAPPTDDAPNFVRTDEE